MIRSCGSVASNDKMISKYCIENDVDGSFRSLIWNLILIFFWRDWGKLLKTWVWIARLQVQVWTENSRTWSRSPTEPSTVLLICQPAELHFKYQCKKIYLFEAQKATSKRAVGSVHNSRNCCGHKVSALVPGPWGLLRKVFVPEIKGTA
jgi:hypothetical protein